MYILSKYLCFQLCSLELFYIWLLILSRYSRHRVSSLALIHEHARTNDQAKRVYDHDNLRGLAIWLAMWDFQEIDSHIVGQQRNLESGKEELPCRVIKIATATAIVVVIVVISLSLVTCIKLPYYIREFNICHCTALIRRLQISSRKECVVSQERD